LECVTNVAMEPFFHVYHQYKSLLWVVTDLGNTVCRKNLVGSIRW
jgi:hypothetical protein